MLRNATAMLLSFGFVLCVIAEHSSARESREVQITQGIVRGYRDPALDIFEYYGIPYATAPIGRDRYKAPLPGPVWLGTRDAIDEKIACPQLVTPVPGLTLNITAQQDCLTANVFVPNTVEANLPVVVYIHGGGFVLGSGNFLKPKRFVSSKKIIAVTINYRLGALGFLCLGSDKIPGNAGLKDAVAALRWVKTNIAKFGGNPDDVAIAGYSAGSFMVDLLMFSKMAEGLFTKVIPESGSNMGSVAMQSDPLKNAKEFAKSKGFTDVDNFKALEDFFTNTPWEQLIPPPELKYDATVPFSPCVERADTSEEPFLSEAPYAILKSGNYKKVPILYGVASTEGLVTCLYFEQYSKLMNEDFASVLPADLQFETHAKRSEVAKLVKEFYFKDKVIGLDTLPAYLAYYGDTYFTIGMTRSIKLHVEAGNNEIYAYMFSYVDEEDIRPVLLETQAYCYDKKYGADHCSQTYTIMDKLFENDLQLNKLESKARLLQVIATTRDLWFNFIAKNKPVPPGSKYPSWPAADANTSPHMNLNDTLELRGAILKERMEFWHKIYEQYYKLPSPPPKPPTGRTEL